MPKPPSRQPSAARLAEAGLAPLDDSVHIYPGREVQVGELTLHVRTTPGEGTEPALFVHGLGGSSHNWTEFAGVLRNRLAVTAIDLPGHGRSKPTKNRRYTPQTHADAIIGYLDQEVGEPVHLAGNSMGGAISILVAARRPDLVRTLTLISPAVPDNRLRVFALKNDPRLAIMILPVVGEAIMKQFNRRYAVEARVAGTIALCFADKSRYPRARRREAEAEARWRLDVPWAESAVLRSMRGLVTSQLLRGRTGWKTMRTVTAPTLVLWGDEDKLVAPDLAPYVAAAIPNAALLVFDDIGHTAMMEDPQRSALAMIALLDDAAATVS